MITMLIAPKVNWNDLANWRKKLFRVGARCDLTDYMGIWYTAKVVEVNRRHGILKFHYDNWQDKWDEWVPVGHMSRLAPFRTKAAGGRGTIMLNDKFSKLGMIHKKDKILYEKILEVSKRSTVLK